jgi:quercetin dioxygenase-like cupin family protein
MRSLRVVTGVCAALVCAAVTSPTFHRARADTKTTPLILEENEGERRVIRPWPGHPDPGETFTLKVDPKNGGSSHLVFITANLAPGGEITPHKHPGADEILYLETGTARVHLGDTVREAHAGATVFIPSGTVISLTNIGKEKMKVVAVFSAPGFEEFMRDVSVLEGQPAPPMTEAEDTAAEKKHAHDVIYQ